MAKSKRRSRGPPRRAANLSHHGTVCRSDQFVDKLRRLLAAQQMLTHRRHWHFREHEHRTADFVRSRYGRTLLQRIDGSWRFVPADRLRADDFRQIKS